MEAGSTKARLDGLDKRVDDLGTQLREQRQEMKAGFEKVDERFDSMQRTLIVAMVAMPGAFAVLLRLIS